MADTLASATGLFAADATAEVDRFAMGFWLIGLSLGVSALGALVGLACVVHGRRSARFRPVWLAAAAVSIGGVGIWLATAVLLLGVAVPGTVLRYDAATLGVSVAVAVIAVFAGLVIAGRELRLPRLLTGGLVMGLGAGLMLYLELAAADVQGSVELTIWLLAVAAVIAVVVAGACLWLFQSRQVLAARVGTIVLFALGVAGMYHTGVAALRFSVDDAAEAPGGMQLFDFVFPMFVLGSLALALPITAVLVAPDRRELAAVDPAPRPVLEPAR
ncbi:MHYT domain-containing protein [Nocardia cyriacigeorgica]|uniref:MHYT domain-containing protein n=1 Tax=Nocardia cyriacigeorgica TaxID=135487 RepID=UPI002453C6AC|nr:MHYT domain-containing protein [Nocardia cyriacigeorgica]